jgi:hypothetical protein
VHNPPSFPPKRSPKNAGSYTFYVWRAVWCLLNVADNGLRIAFLADFFYQKSAPTNRKEFYTVQTVCRRIRRLDGFLYEAEKKLSSLLKNSSSEKIKLAVMSFSRPVQWYHSHADLISPDGTIKVFPRMQP